MCAAMSNQCGVDVWLDEDILKKAPHCPHGPTLLFERYVRAKETSQLYYACSACRDRKDCGFFQLYSDNETVSEMKKMMREEYNKSRQPWKQQEEFFSKYEQTIQLPESDRRFCYDCQLLVLPGDCANHKKHQLKVGISLEDLKRPSYLMEAIEDNKTNAQYLFSDQAVKFLVQTIKSLGFKRVLCVGVPRLHEYICEDKSTGLDSLLLDIDHRYGQFYPPRQFCRYNMFNHFFLDGQGSLDTCKEFLGRSNGNKVVMVTDPPFGGLVDVLASGVKWLMDLWKSNVKEMSQELPVMWIFPYFLEHRIVASLPSFKMLDYKVDYHNHPLFKSGPHATKKGSPVRIFTNIDPSKVILPKSEGYRFCSICQRYVAAENKHCDACNECSSKNGTTYHHCSACNKCVKPSFTHCQTCDCCELPTHDCSRSVQGCHICGAPDHKRRDCPKRTATLKRKHKQKRLQGDDKSRSTWPRLKRRKLENKESHVTSAGGGGRGDETVIISETCDELLNFLNNEDETISPNVIHEDENRNLTSSCVGSEKGQRRDGTSAINVDQRPHVSQNGQSCQSSSGVGVQSETSMLSSVCDTFQKSKLSRKKMKLMQRIQKMKMKRKLKLKL